MNLTITKEDLIRSLGVVQSVASGRSSLPILNNVLLRASGDKLHVTATDLDTSISCSVDAVVKEAGATTVSAKRLYGIVREFGNPSVSMVASDKHVVSLVCGNSSYKINGLSADEFPPIPETKAPAGDGITAPQAAMKKLLSQTVFAVSEDTSRYVMCGVFLTVKDASVVAVATDGRRMAFAEMLGVTGVSAAKEAIVPSKAAAEVLRLLGGKGDVKIVFSGNQVEFALSGGEMDVTLKSKLVEGNYPNWRQVVPRDIKHKVTLPREELMAAVSRAKLMTTENFGAVKLVFAKNNLRVTVNAAGTGEAQEDITVNHSGEEVSIAFNPDYFLQGLGAVSDDEVFMEMVDGLSPFIVKINGPFMYVISPMRLS